MNEVTHHRQHTSLHEQSLEELEFSKMLELIVPYAMTERAANLIRQLRPLSDAESVEAVHCAIEEIIALRSRGEDLPIERTDDPQRCLSRAEIVGAHLSANELLSILELLGASRRLAQFIRERAEMIPHVAAFAVELVEHRLLERHVRDAIDPTGAVRDDATAALRAIRSSIEEISARLRSKLRRIVQRLGDEDLLQDEFYTQRDGRLVVPLKVEYKRALAGIIHGVSQTGATVFFEPSEVFELNNELAELRAAEEREIVRILQALTSEVGAHASSIRAADASLTLLDSLRARALFAENYRGKKPRIVKNEPVIELRNVFHPLLVASKGFESVVPLSLPFDSEHQGYLVSGPNAGGKSIAIKTIGISTAMALAGIFPLGEMTVSPVTILAAIGDHQSIESNLSTFSSQLVRLREILTECRNATLVIVDEICSGTDPTEGSALAAAIIDEILDRGVFIVATTHQFVLKTYALSRPHLLNASMEFDLERLEPTYRFLPGVPGNSYAFELAAALKLPNEVLDRARHYLGSEHSKIEESIHQLQQLRRVMEERATAAAREYQEAERLRNEYEVKFHQFKTKYTQLIEAAQRHADELVRTTKEQLRHIRAKAERGEHEAARADLCAFQEQIERHLPQEHSQQTEQLAVGDYVELRATGQRGKVIEVTPHHVVLEIGAVRLNISPDKVRRVEGAPLNQPSRHSRPIKLDAPTELDLRGLRVQEALSRLERALNDAVLGGVGRLKVLHGTGSGRLRQAIHEYLNAHPLVAAYRAGSAGQTDWGTTYVELR